MEPRFQSIKNSRKRHIKKGKEANERRKTKRKSCSSDRRVQRHWRRDAVQGDVAKKKDIERLFAEAKQAFGKIDILVNNAGVYDFKPLEEVTEIEFQREFNTNVLGLILASQEAVKHFDSDGGSVINVSSVASSATPPHSVIYTGTKGAVDAITRVLAKELGPRKIRVNAVNPGGIETEGFRAMGIPGTDFEKQMVASFRTEGWILWVLPALRGIASCEPEATQVCDLRATTSDLAVAMSLRCR